MDVTFNPGKTSWSLGFRLFSDRSPNTWCTSGLHSPIGIDLKLTLNKLG